MKRADARAAADLLRRVLNAVATGALSADGRAGANVVRRLEGALLALGALGRRRSPMVTHIDDAPDLDVEMTEAAEDAVSAQTTLEVLAQDDGDRAAGRLRSQGQPRVTPHKGC